MREGGEEQIGNILCCTEREILKYKYECPSTLSFFKTENNLHYIYV